MAKGIVDVYVSTEMEDSSVNLVLDCGGGLPNDLHLIEDRTELTLRRGSVNSEIELIQEKGNECAFNYMEISSETAQRFGLKSGDRVVLDYRPATKTLSMQRLNSSTAFGILLHDPRKNRDRVITIGYALLSQLGIPEDVAGQNITLTRGTISKQLRVIIPQNELDETFRLSASNLKAMSLSPRRKWKLSYNQTTKIITIVDTITGISKQVKRTVKPVRKSKSTALPNKRQPKKTKV
ncbi:hypothetical protein [Paenibacillus sp. UNC451MF]|uniref:hypothetical protein n=1 Tax=Paenibacillus sp. UNC451MF TaxID=1449063 RepID=UPI000491CE3B|nr:hypothetical protein [Paenibacillus sp. UNC451MF]